MTATRLRWLLLGGVAVVGALLFDALLDPGLRAALSYLAGLALVIGAFEFGSFNIRFTGRHLPSLTMMVAILSYATTAVALGLVLAAATPRVVQATAIASGLLVGLPIWIGTEIVRARPQAERR